MLGDDFSEAAAPALVVVEHPVPQMSVVAVTVHELPVVLCGIIGVGLIVLPVNVHLEEHGAKEELVEAEKLLVKLCDIVELLQFNVVSIVEFCFFCIKLSLLGDGLLSPTDTAT
jgi:hypothetical protein